VLPTASSDTTNSNPFALGLQSLADAVAIRNKVLQAFEQAEAEEDPSRHRDLLTFVLVGAGPTAVELASAIAGLVRSTTFRVPSNYLVSARIRVDKAPRVLETFTESHSRAAEQRLKKLGVEVRLIQRVDRIDESGVGRCRRANRKQNGHLDCRSRSFCLRKVP
jgi:NADH dehydrogenase